MQPQKWLGEKKIFTEPEVAPVCRRSARSLSPAKILAQLARNLSENSRVEKRELGRSSVAENQGVLIITEDTVIRGVREMRNCRQLEVHGYVEGDVSARDVLVHKTGRLFGTVKTDTAEIHGTVQGDVAVKNLIDIRSSGNVSGNVKYGKLALEMGGNLTAEMRNVPPSVGGDLNLEVAKGHTVPITLQDAHGPRPRRRGHRPQVYGYEGEERFRGALRARRSVR